MSLDIFGFLLNTLWIKTKNQYNIKIIQELEEISSWILWIIEKQNLESLINKLREVRELDFSWILWYFVDIAKDYFSWKELSLHLKKYLEKRTKEKETNSHHLEIALWIALLDIYSLVLLKKSFWVNENKLKGLLYLSMKHWNADINNVISHIISKHIILEWNKINIDNLLEKLKVASVQQIPEHTYWEASCPFYASKETKDWVDKIWIFFENQLIPEIQKNFSHKRLPWEKFYSGNLSKA